VVQVLNAVYEEDFLGFSYGFRPGRGQHDGLDALWVGLMGKKVNWVLDADIQGFFDTISHEWLLRFLEHRVADRRILRLIQKWLRAGFSEDGQRAKTEVGTPQGSVISPLLANVYLHYVLDLWVQQWRKRHSKGDVIVVRYADDFVMGFQHREEAGQFLLELQGRMQQFGLTLHPGKTRLIEFGRFAAENRHHPVAQQGHWLGQVVRGYFNYHALPGNAAALETFRREVVRAWLHALRRRSQRSRLTWSRFVHLVDVWLPRPKILHPYPNVRFFAMHPR